MDNSERFLKMTDIYVLISLLVLAVLGLFAVISALIGLGRGLKKTIGSTVVIIVSAVFALIITLTVFRPSSEIMRTSALQLSEMLQELSSDMADILGLPSVSEAMIYYVYMILSPFIFIILFLIIRLVLGITMRIVIRFIPLLGRLPKVAHRLGGLGLGLINGVILCSILFMPLLGTVDVAKVAVEQIESMQENDENPETESADFDITECLNCISGKGAGKVMLTMGKPFYNTLTSTKYYGEKVTLSSEISTIGQMASEISGMDDGNTMTVAVDAVVGGVEKSPIIKNFAAELISSMAQAWLDGDTFMGMSKISVGEDFDPAIDAVLGVFATEDREHIVSDLKAVGGFIKTADEYGLMSSENSGSDILNLFAESGKFSGLLANLDQNERMLPIIDEVNRLAINIFADQFGIYNSKDEIYVELTAKINETRAYYQTGGISRVDAEHSLTNILEDYAIDSESDEAKAFIKSILDGTYEEKELKKLDMKIVTTDELLGLLVKYGDIEDRTSETEKIDAVMVSIVSSYNDMDFDGEEIHASDVMDLMGGSLDYMKKTNVYGGMTDKFLMSIMQSHKVADSIGLSVMEMTEFAEKISAGCKNDTGYKEISHTIANSFSVLENMNDTEHKSEKIKDLMKDLTPESAGVMQEITTPSLMMNYGVKEDKAEKSSDAISKLFGNMSTYKESHPQGELSDDEYKESINHEAEAVNKIITIAIKASEDKEDKGDLFSRDEQSGSLDMSAYDVVDLFVNSDVASDTVDDLVRGEDGELQSDPMGIHGGLGEADREEITNALNDYAAANSDVDGIDDRLSDIAHLFGVEYSAQ